ncbi:MAG: FAD-binding domain-containing protein [Ilumatobacteraceae bacterium]|nr:FAD-binding domain-containing protein [Ilumatobacteraceae bacterium]
MRQWVPELMSLPDGSVHQPGLARPASYPAPIVDHAAERDEALARYRSLSTASR